MAGKPVTIYALADESGVRYIGQTRQPIQMRVYQHRMDLTTGGAAKIAWIKALRASGRQPSVEVLEVVAASAAAEAERRHIAAATARGCHLLNVKRGGVRGREHDDERNVVRVALRLPLDLHAELTGMRAEDERSLHAEIIWCVRQCAAHRRREKRRNG